jgi:hypothetical protein
MNRGGVSGTKAWNALKSERLTMSREGHTRPGRTDGRRALLRVACAAPLLILAAAVATGADAEECVSSGDLTEGETSLRRSVEFVEVSPDPATACTLCSFFTADKTACGHCTILSGPVAPVSHCRSWAPRKSA